MFKTGPQLERYRTVHGRIVSVRLGEVYGALIDLWCVCSQLDRTESKSKLGPRLQVITSRGVWGVCVAEIIDTQKKLNLEPSKFVTFVTILNRSF